MTKADFIDDVHRSLDGTTKKDATTLVQATFDAVANAVKSDGRFSFPGFGTFTVKERAARQGRNPRTGVSIMIPASKSVGFKASASFKADL